jgi:hypothetical protein
VGFSISSFFAFFLFHSSRHVLDVLFCLYFFYDVASGEAERIKKCEGRIFAADEDPDVYRVWMPEDDCPGLAMSRAFGDFCLKDCGLISIPEVSYRKLTSSDEFLVLATDGVRIQKTQFKRLLKNYFVHPTHIKMDSTC